LIPTPNKFDNEEAEEEEEEKEVVVDGKADAKGIVDGKLGMNGN
jgi:hypothetical protein